MTDSRRVLHKTFGSGIVIAHRGQVLTVEFDDGRILKVPAGEVEERASTSDAVASATWSSPLAVMTRTLAAAIRSTNDRWGVFSPSRIAVLPHQLWVCQRVLRAWPSRWLIADDVGLGKTIEAGLILTPLVSRGHVKRLLILCPAGLVPQWAERLREMFDLRMALYHPEVDSPKSDFWQVHSQVVASLHTLRLDRDERWDRLLDAPRWDLVLVDEAHHLGADDSGKKTLGLQLLEKLDERGLIGGLLLFAGTPHRGKDFGFLSLLRLVDPEIDPRRGVEPYLERLPEIMIRNNKQNVTDMRGAKLFQPVRVSDAAYSYSADEASFYAKLTEFIQTGRAYAGSMQRDTQRQVMLVLTTMQKLAASSVAAVRKALEGRLAKLRAQESQYTTRSAALARAWRELEAIDPDAEPERRARLEEQIDQLMEGVQLNPDEIPALEELVESAAAVRSESRVSRLMELTASLPDDEAVLFFTEYKATQALVVSSLAQRFGDASVAFINGDGELRGVVGPDGTTRTMRAGRFEVAQRFNAGEVRFLVSTEAAGEGIDLQRNCRRLVHVDIPWNPMRMHQRVGRINRYGQTRPVEVHIVRNPATIESRIWELLNEKLDRIALAFENSMADPEDIRGLVLGLVSSASHERIAARALGVRAESFAQWYDAETATFGGEGAVAVVRALLGHVARFDFQAASAEIPRVDLPELRPFLRAALRQHQRRPDEKDDGVLAFITPKAWQDRHAAVRDRYDVHFDRGRAAVSRGPVLVGAGHRMIEAALDDAESRDDQAASVPGLSLPLVVFICSDDISVPSAAVRRVAYGVEIAPTELRVLQDWELVLRLNALLDRPDRAGLRDASTNGGGEVVRIVNEATAWFEQRLAGLDLPFRKPVARLHSVLWPAS